MLQAFLFLLLCCGWLSPYFRRCRFELFPSTFVKRKYKPGLDVFARMPVQKALGDVSDARFTKSVAHLPLSWQKYLAKGVRKQKERISMRVKITASQFTSSCLKKYSRSLSLHCLFHFLPPGELRIPSIFKPSQDNL